MNKISERVTGIMAEIMEVEESSINLDTNPDNMPQWDSLSHVQLVLALEKEFGVTISPEDGIEHLASFKDILKFLGT